MRLGACALPDEIHARLHRAGPSVQRAPIKAVRTSAEAALAAHFGAFPEIRRDRARPRILLVILIWRGSHLFQHLVAISVVGGVERLQRPMRILQGHNEVGVMHPVHFLPGVFRQRLLGLLLSPRFRKRRLPGAVVTGPRHVAYVVLVCEGLVNVPRPSNACRHAAKLRAFSETHALLPRGIRALFYVVADVVPARPRQDSVLQNLDLVRSESPRRELERGCVELRLLALIAQELFHLVSARAWIFARRVQRVLDAHRWVEKLST
mmetsp:Transcript_116820/g.330504  ORF Transcript_116820/g.330504 Transcript_116820/m.330504 type:complete len:265 (-) Transcript_116820:563-1357(-)